MIHFTPRHETMKMTDITLCQGNEVMIPQVHKPSRCEMLVLAARPRYEHEDARTRILAL